MSRTATRTAAAAALALGLALVGASPAVAGDSRQQNPDGGSTWAGSAPPSEEAEGQTDATWAG